MIPPSQEQEPSQDKPAQNLRESFAEQAGDGGYDVIVDCVWGRPTEALLDSMTRKEFANLNRDAGLVQVGESAGSTISLPAAVLRRSANSRAFHPVIRLRCS
jgi:hypothetical protein